MIDRELAIELVRDRLNIINSQHDSRIKDFLNRMEQRARAYCNYCDDETLPLGLINIIVDIVEQCMRNYLYWYDMTEEQKDNPRSVAQDNLLIKSKQLGDLKIEYHIPNDATSSTTVSSRPDDFVSNVWEQWTDELNSWVKMICL